MILKALVFRYFFFAILATFINIIGQRFILMISDSSQALIYAIGFGTLLGLVAKYYLDKRWIFLDKSTGIKTNSYKFTLYSIMGVATTFIFWGFEAAFWITWKTDIMREVGAIIGLSIGYLIKYRLDRKFVFIDSLAKNKAFN
jgi:putative flippase GtrA